MPMCAAGPPNAVQPISTNEWKMSLNEALTSCVARCARADAIGARDGAFTSARGETLAAAPRARSRYEKRRDDAAALVERDATVGEDAHLRLLLG
jgi:hypothetical protein